MRTSPLLGGSPDEPIHATGWTIESVVDWQRMLLVVAVVGVLVLLLRWAYSGSGRSSLVERRPRMGHSNEYGLLVAISAPGTYIEAEVMRRRLEDAGIRAALITTADGPRVMVFPENEIVARQLLAAS
jgi:hypothetical protein